ncbi:lipid IV(A) 3-deoxy-D-manno-octulosonic acid transferase [Corallincola platygyrae]|uniref:3-deoxy-D-manno-octulosonic acid transferase n=1 Tax=Corallincola platygyrae TaxID=1193278 RepID=A0ABW4XQ01_9GAMM
MRLIYSLLIYLALPFGLFWLHWPKGSKPAVGKRWPEHLGFVPDVEGNPVWFHAVSVGEVIAITPLIQRLLDTKPDFPVMVTTTTRTGADRVEAAFGDRVIHRYAPFDLPGATKRFLARTRPRLAVVMEMELWPNTLAACRRKGVRALLINARMSAQSRKGYGRFKSLISPILQTFEQIQAQTRMDAARLVELGAKKDVVTVTGSLKFDIKLSDEAREAGSQLRTELGKDRPVWIAASTHPNEDEAALEAHKLVRQDYPDAALILVPRHPGRFDDVMALCQRTCDSAGDLLNGGVRRRSLQPADNDCAVYLADTMGEMMMLLSASDICFLGGSLIPHGGHNLLEPAAVGMPTLTGPSDFHFEEITQSLVDAGNCQRIADGDELALKLKALFGNKPSVLKAADAGRQVVLESQGALEKMLDAILAAYSRR